MIEMKPANPDLFDAQPNTRGLIENNIQCFVFGCNNEVFANIAIDGGNEQFICEEHVDVLLEALQNSRQYIVGAAYEGE